VRPRLRPPPHADGETLLAVSQRRIEAACDDARARMASAVEKVLAAERNAHEALKGFKAGRTSFRQMMAAVAETPDDA
jgi:hypothetical protein